MELRRCQPDDLQAIIDLNETIYAALPDKSVLRHNSPEMIASCLEEPNVTFGIWDGNLLVAIGMLYVPQCLEEDHAHDLDLVEEYKSANQKLFLVREGYRGQGLHHSGTEQYIQYQQFRERRLYLCQDRNEIRRLGEKSVL